MGDVLTYFDSLTASKTWLGSQPDTIFIGQSVAYPGNALYKTLEGVPMEKRLEFPVAEDCQLGVSIGLAMMGKTVISIYPRMDFLLCALNQLVNHLDKNLYPLKGKVIIRTCIGATKPLHPGVQHCGDYTEGIVAMLKNSHIVSLAFPSMVMDYYKMAYQDCQQKNWLIIEEADLYAT